MKKEFITLSAAETEAAGEKLGKELAKQKQPAVIAFFGGMGMGKTAFVRGLCRGVGYKGEVSSPTFAVVHEYEGGVLPVYHFDMYRVSDAEDLYSCGFYDYSDWLTVAEWSENIAFAVPADHVEVRITQLDESRREICVSLVRGDCQ